MSIRRFSPAGEAPLRSSGRSWPVTRRPASPSIGRPRSSTQARSLHSGASRSARRTTRGAVYERSAALAVDLLDEVLPDPSFIPQPEEGVTYAEKIRPEDRELDWSRPPQEVHDRIRALSPHIGARGELTAAR